MKLKKIAVVVLTGILLAGAAMAEEAKSAEKEERSAWIPSLELKLDHKSRYMSEGCVGNPDPIETIELTAEWGVTDNFSVHISGLVIIDETDANDLKHDAEEWDWKAGITYSIPDLAAIGTLEFTADYIYYTYPHDSDTHEYEIDVNATDLFLSPGIAFVHDFRNHVVKYNVNVTYEKKLDAISEHLSFECPAELWFGNRQFSGCDSDATAYSFCLEPTLKYELNENVSVGAYVQMGWSLDGRVRGAWKDDPNNNAFNCCWGLNLTATL